MTRALTYAAFLALCVAGVWVGDAMAASCGPNQGIVVNSKCLSTGCLAQTINNCTYNASSPPPPSATPPGNGRVCNYTGTDPNPGINCCVGGNGTVACSGTVPGTVPPLACGWFSYAICNDPS